MAKYKKIKPRMKKIQKKKDSLKGKEIEFIIESKKFRHKKTGEILTQIPLMEIGDFEEV